MLKDFVRVSKAMSDGTRVRIVSLLRQRELCVCQIMKILGMGQSTVSKHLGILRDAGLIESDKRGTWSFYRLSREGTNRHTRDFIRLLPSLPGDDPSLQKDARKLKEVGRKGPAFCSAALKRRQGERREHAG